MLLDFHAHYSPDFFRYREHAMDIDDTLRMMDTHAVARAVLSCAGEYAALLHVECNRQIGDAMLRRTNGTW
jgi:hypothetical protein